MIKNITFILIFCCMLISCGKKGDPEYKGTEKKVKIQSVLINKA
tara:strand:+ start:88 stop:219 length:132 start_codon:yes stop_codon:yes gene_type:complete